MKKISIFILGLFTYTFLATSAFAQAKLKGNECVYPGGGLGGVVTISCIFPLFTNLVYWLIILSGTVAVFFVIFGGIKFLTSSGDQQKVESAKKTITFAIIGLVVVLLSFMIVNVVADITGIECSQNFGGTIFVWCNN